MKGRLLRADNQSESSREVVESAIESSKIAKTGSWEDAAKQFSRRNGYWRPSGKRVAKLPCKQSS